MSIELKIKSKHLGEEARIIKFEEHKLLQNLRNNISWHKASGDNSEYPFWSDKNLRDYISLSMHRKRNVRHENRATFLARAYIAGKPYLETENKRNPAKEYDFKTYILPRVVAMVCTYGKVDRLDKVYDNAKRRYVYSQELKDKISTWCTIN